MVDQIAIVSLGCIAIWLSQDPRPQWQRWACVFGLAGQPFWIFAAWSVQQWGVLALSMVYAIAWGRGFWVHWIVRKST